MDRGKIECKQGLAHHDLRHDFAHSARQSGWSLEEIAVYAGHQTKDGAPAIATSVHYTLMLVLHMAGRCTGRIVSVEVIVKLWMDVVKPTPSHVRLYLLDNIRIHDYTF